ncbi:MAG TPA: type VI secretion system protein [Polyangiaceae bacterium]|nr:type VI secretion system protein [Polyangiaceae bacterium]
MTSWAFSLISACAALCGLLVLALIVRARGLDLPWRRWFSAAGAVARWLGRGLLALLQRLRRAGSSLRETWAYLARRAQAPYGVPLLLAIGQPGSGKTALLSALSAARATHQRLQRELGLSEQPHWHFLESGVVIDLDGPEAGEEAWQRTLREVDERRPERPVDGVVVTVSARLFAAGEAEQLGVARALFDQLWALQAHLGFALPVYWVVTQLDALPGFRAFWAQLSAGSGQMLGWSSPARADAQFDEAWVGRAFGALRARMRELQLEALARGVAGPEVEPLLLFPEQFEQLREPLARFARTAFAQTVHQAGVSLRGLYFSAQLDGGSPALASDLFEQKIFVERNLATPLRPQLWSRSYVLRRLQRGVVAGFGLALALLGLSAAHLAWRSAQQRQALRAAAAARPTFDRDCPSAERAQSQLLDGALTEPASFYLALPASWFDHRSERGRTRFMTDGVYESTLFPALRCRLRADAELLARTPSAGDPQPGPLARVAALARWEQQRALFEALAHDSALRQRPEALQDTAQLVEATLGFLPGPALEPGARIATEALRAVDYAPAIVGDLSAQREAMSQALLAVAERHRAGLRDSALAGVEACERLARSGPELSADLRTVAEWNKGTGAEWARADALHNPCASVAGALQGALLDLRQLRPPYSNARFDEAVALFSEQACYSPIARELRQAKDSRCGAWLGLTGGEPARASTAASAVGASAVALAQGTTRKVESLLAAASGARSSSAESRALDQLAAAPFLQGPAPPVFACRSPAAWRAEPIGEAVAALKSYQRLVEPLGSAGQAALTGVRQRLLAWVAGSLQAAQVPAAEAPDPAQLSLRFGRVVPSLIELSTLLGQLGVEWSEAPWALCLRDFALDALTGVAQRWGDPFAVQPAVLPAPAGGSSPRPRQLFVGLRDTSQARQHFQGGLDRVQQLMQQVAPYLQWLDASAGLLALPSAARPLVSRLRATQDELEAHAASQPSSVSALSDFFEQTLAGLSDGNCEERLAAAPPGADADELSAAQQRLFELASGACERLRDVDWASRYAQVARAFRDHLAGKFPFAAPDAPDVAVQEIVLVNQLLADPALAALWQPPPEEQAAADQSDFLDRLRRSLAQLQPLLDGKAALDVQAALRRASPRSRSTDDILSWTLSSGGQRAYFPNGSEHASWRLGDALSFELRWADRSPLRPLAAGPLAARPEQTPPAASADGTSARWSQRGEWALLRWIASYRDRSRLAPPGQVTLRYRVPLRSLLRAGDVGYAEVFLDLSLTAPDATPFDPDLFPRRAP